MSKLNKSIIAEFEAAQMQRALPDFGPGDTVIVNVKVTEGNRERVPGLRRCSDCQAQSWPELRFHCAQDLHGTGVERVFQSHSPLIDSVEVKRRGKVRAAKLYYLRDLEGKAARIKEVLGAAR